MGQLKTPPYIKTGYMSSLIDIEAYHDELIIHKTPGQDYQVGKVYQTPPLTGGGGEFASVVVNLFKGLPDGAILQVNELCFPDHGVAHRQRPGHHVPAELELVWVLGGGDHPHALVHAVGGRVAGRVGAEGPA